MRRKSASMGILILQLVARQSQWCCLALQSPMSRRDATIALVSGGISGLLGPSWEAMAQEESTTAARTITDYSLRDRQNNKNAVIRDDYWYISGKCPPRILSAPLKGDDPAFNAFGSCTSSESTGNSCTYVSLKQRQPAYTKYASSIRYGASEYQTLGQLIKAGRFDEAVPYLEKEANAPPPAIVDAELKTLLFATAMLTSPNFPGPSKELLIARYYVNELHYTNAELLQAVYDKDRERALSLWEYGRDAWNSYYQVIDRQVVPKVGDKFDPIV